MTSSPRPLSEPATPTLVTTTPRTDDPGPGTRSRGGANVPRRRVFWPMMGAAIVGAGVGFAGYVAADRYLDLDDYLTTYVDGYATTYLGVQRKATGVSARLAALESQVHTQGGSPTPAPVDSAAMEELKTRLAKLEAGTATTTRPTVPDPAIANRIAAVETEVKTLGERLGTVGRRTEESAAAATDARARLDAITAGIADLKDTVSRQTATFINRDQFDAAVVRLAAAERRTTELQSELERQAAKEVSDRVARAALAAAALRAAVERGEGFTAELASAKSYAADPKMLAPLDLYASGGVPTSVALGRELSLIVPALMQAAAPAQADGNYWQRLRSNAEKVMKVRPTDSVPGDTPAAIVARIELRALAADIDGALAELAKLPAELRTSAQVWIGRAQAHVAALDLVRRYAAGTVTALNKPAS